MNTHSAQTASQPGQLANALLLDNLDSLEGDAPGDASGNAAQVFGLMSAKLTSWKFSEDSWRVDED